MEYLIKLGIQGLKRVLANNAFTESAASKEEMEVYEELSNPVVGFLKEYKDQIENESTLDVFRLYEIYCEENNLHSVGRNQLTREVCKTLGLKYVTRRINGKREQLFVRK